MELCAEHVLLSIPERYLNRSNIAYGFFVLYQAAEIETSRGRVGLEKEFENLEMLLQVYGSTPGDYLSGILFINLISEVEAFIKEILVVVREVRSKEAEYSELPSAENILGAKGASKQMELISKVLGISEETFNGDWSVYAEARERRHTGVHGRWVSDDNYIKNAGKYSFVPVDLGESTLPNQDYVMNFMNAAGRIIDIMTVYGENILARNVSA